MDPGQNPPAVSGGSAGGLPPTAETKRPLIPRPSGLPTLRKPSSATSTSSSIENLRPSSKEKERSTLSLSTTNQDPDRVLTSDTDSFIIGDTVWVGGSKRGRIAFIGETQFAKGEWAGVVLDEPSGKNDGLVSGVRYFQCDPLHGMFTKLTRLSRKPLIPIDPSKLCEVHGSTPPRCLVERQRSPSPFGGNPTSPGQSTPAQYRIGSPTSPGAPLKLGDRVIVQSSTAGTKRGVLRYIGPTEFADGEWAGIELDQPQGKNDGTVQGKRYFSCAPKFGLFAPVAKVSSSPANRRPPSSIKRYGSKESLASNLSSVISSASRNIRSVRKPLPPPPSSLGGPPNKCLPTCGLQPAMREMEIHLDQLMQEKEIDRQELVQLNKLLAQKSQQQLPQIDQVTDALRAEVERYKQEVKVQKAANEQLVAKIDDLTRKLDDLQFSYEEEKIYHNDLQSQLTGKEGHDNEVGRLSAELLERTVTQSKLDQDLTSLRTELDRALAANAGMEQAVKNLAVAEVDAENLRAELALNVEKVKQLRSAETELESVRTELKELKVKLEDSCSKEATLTELKSKYEFEVKELQISKEELEEELKSALEKLSSLSTLKDSCLSEYESKYKCQIDELEIQLREVKANSQLILLNVQESVQAELKVKEAELSKMKETNEELEGRVKSSQDNLLEQTNSNAVEINRLKELIQKGLEDKVASTNESAKLLEIFKMELENSKAGSNAIETELTQLHHKLTITDTEIVQLKAKIQEFESEKSEAIKCRQSLQDELNVKNELVQEKSHSLQILEENLKAATDEVVHLAQNLHEKTSALEEATSAITLLKSNIETVDSKAAEFAELNSATITERETRIVQLETKLDAAHSESLKLKTELQKLEKMELELRTKNEELQNLEQNLKVARDEALQLSENLNEKTSALEEVTSAMTLLKLNVETLEIKAAELSGLNSTTILEKENRIADLEAKLETAESKSLALQTELQKIEKMELELRAKNDENVELESRIKAFAEDVKKFEEKSSKLSEEKESMALKLQNYETQIETSKAESNSYKIAAEKELAQLREQMDKELEKREDEVKKLTEKSERFQAELKLSQERATMLVEQKNWNESEKEKAFEAQLKNFESAKSKLESELEKSRDKELKLVKEQELLIQEKEKMALELGKEQKRFFELEEKLKVTESKFQEELAQIKENNEAETNKKEILEKVKIESLETEIQTLQENLQKLQTEQNDLLNLKSEQLKKIGDLEIETEQQRSTITNCKKVNSDLDRENNEIQVMLQSKIKSLEEELQASLTRTKEEQLQQETLKIESNKISENYKSEIAGLNLQLQNAESSLREFGNRKEFLVAELKAKEAELQNSNLKAAEFELKLAEVEGKTNEISVENKTKLEEQTKALDELQKKYEENILAETKKMEKLQQENEKILAENSAILSEKQKAETKIADYEPLLQELKKKLTDFEVREKTLNQEATDAKAQAKETELKLIDIQKTKDTLEIQLRETADLAAQKDEACRTGESKAKAAQNDLEIFQKKYDAALTENEALEAMLRSEKENFGRQKSIYAKRIGELEASEAYLVKMNKEILTKAETAKGQEAKETGKNAPIGDNTNEKLTIDFLNSVIVSLQLENQQLKQQLEILVSGNFSDHNRNLLETSYGTDSALGALASSRPYCDICEEFDLHDTDDCPKQSNEEPESNSHHHESRGAVRKYCTSCEVFGHSVEECDAGETY